MANNTVVTERPVVANVVTKIEPVEADAVTVTEPKEGKKGLANGGVLGYAVGDANNALFRTFINAKATVSKTSAAKVFSSIIVKAMETELDPKVKRVIDLQKQLNKVLES